MCREEFISSPTTHDRDEDELTLDLSIWQYEDEEHPRGYQLIAQGFIALSTTITFIRCLALFFPHFVHRLFRTQVEAGKHLQVYFNTIKQWLRPYLSTIFLGVIIFSTPHARNFLQGGGE